MLRSGVRKKSNHDDHQAQTQLPSKLLKHKKCSKDNVFSEDLSVPERCVNPFFSRIDLKPQDWIWVCLFSLSYMFELCKLILTSVSFSFIANFWFNFPSANTFGFIHSDLYAWIIASKIV